MNMWAAADVLSRGNITCHLQGPYQETYVKQTAIYRDYDCLVLYSTAYRDSR
jgi:hypothetical protein